ncbi:hypothetical protein Bhyg_00843 [Pseudolycoriella hygida]|uniref:Uncharacterized protein n=1 Tax=Pseudolycoriella hygida TaxID=35572 RepID=A0A9Q0N9S0_9DIPT|nr:hypothetical protein Bhyg_00843 [Pseudolycoriella hygida]
MGSFVYLLAVITIASNFVPVVLGDCEMDCTDLQMQQMYRSSSEVNSGSNANTNIETLINAYRNCVRVCKEKQRERSDLM